MAISSLARPKVQTITATGGNAVFDLPFPDRGQVLRIHRFTSSSDFTVTAGSGLVEVLIQAGGGGGGCSNSDYSAGGGGAGGLLIETYLASATENLGSGAGVYPVVVGAFGAGGTSSGGPGANGSNSSVFGLTAVGGGFGCGHSSSGAKVGGNGGSGGSGEKGGNHGTAVFGQGTIPDTYSAFQGGVGGGLNLTLNFDGVERLYARNGRPSARDNDGKAGGPTNDIGLPGAGGRGGSNSTGNYVNPGGAGGSGMVIIRYPVRSL